MILSFSDEPAGDRTSPHCHDRHTPQACRAPSQPDPARRGLGFDASGMLHDSLAEGLPVPRRPGERRMSARSPCPAELTVLWHHDPSTIVRYRLVNVSDGGLRIMSSAPLIDGMTGMALAVLPEGDHLDRPIMVRWQHPSENGRGWEIGLTYLS
jgi:hypothetical protein